MAQSVASVDLFLSGINRADVNIGGWGVVLVAGKNKKTLYGGHFGVGSGENVSRDVMAMHGLMNGLSALTLPTKVRVLTTSQYIVDLCSKWLGVWVESGWKTKTGDEIPHKDALRVVADLLAKHEVAIVLSPSETEGLFVDALALASQGVDERLDEGRSSMPGDAVTQKNDGGALAKTEGGLQSTAKPAVQDGQPVTSHIDMIPLASEASETDALKALLRECLPVLCGGLSLSFIKKNDPTSLAVRVAVATE